MHISPLAESIILSLVNQLYHSVNLKTLKKAIFVLVVASFFKLSYGQEKTIPLYEGMIPNSKIAPAEYVEHIDSSGLTRNLSNPSITPYLPEKGTATGTAVIICPGGGYLVLPTMENTLATVKAFNKMGVTVFVLRYRMPNDKVMIDKTIGPLQDLQRAILIVRKRATEWGINPNKIGVAGFSAGGHLATTLGTHQGWTVIDNKENISLRPDFMVLVYPVILFDPKIPSGVRERLIGMTPSKELLDRFSNEKHVSPDTPPTFLVHTADDDTVPVKNSLNFFDALLKAKVKASMHIFQAGEHGFGLDNPGNKDKWIDMCQHWMEENGF